MSTPRQAYILKPITAIVAISVLTILATLAGCATAPQTHDLPSVQGGQPVSITKTVPVAVSTPPAMPIPTTLPVASPTAVSSSAAQPLHTLPNWSKDRVLEALPALLHSCQKIAIQVQWQPFCTALKTSPNTEQGIRSVLQQYLLAYPQRAPDAAVAAKHSIATAYFEPVYPASLQPVGEYQWALYGAPTPMTRLPRAQLTPVDGAVHASLQGKELAYLSSPIDAFLAQVQGSVQLQLLDGSTRRLGFSGKNGQPYQSIANTLIAQGAFSAAQASMDTIKDWAHLHNNDEVQAVLNTNPSFVFFKWVDLSSQQGAIGALGVPLTPMRSVAVDTAHTPLGAPVWLETHSLNGALVQLMVVAQDTCGAIKGAGRVDIYAGTGDAAGQFASAQKAPTKVWVLLPKQ
jgi:membrane-bound lytic murein transglycosylase A